MNEFYPETPMTMVGGAVPSLIMHQLSSVRRRSRSSRCSCRRIGTPLIVTSRMSGRATPSALVKPAAAILKSEGVQQPQRRIPSNRQPAAPLECGSASKPGKFKEMMRSSETGHAWGPR
jgi:hypothetical protein